MRRADRLIELAGCLTRDKAVRAEDLAARLEVSVRTVYRDIATLQAHGHPIEGAAGVGFLLHGDIHLAPIAFDHDELEALALGLAYAAQVGDPKLVAAARTARYKVDRAWHSAGRPPPLARPIRARQRPNHRSPDFGAMLRGALRVRRLVSFAYVDGDERRSARTVRPLALTAYSEGWLLGAWCLLRADFRTFRLDRMGELALGAPFADEPGKDLAAYLERVGASR